MLGAQVGGFVCPKHRATPVPEFVCRACLVIPTAAAGEQLERHPSEQATRQPRAPRTPVRPSWGRAGTTEVGSLSLAGFPGPVKLARFARHLPSGFAFARPLFA